MEESPVVWMRRLAPKSGRATRPCNYSALRFLRPYTSGAKRARCRSSRLIRSFIFSQKISRECDRRRLRRLRARPVCVDQNDLYRWKRAAPRSLIARGRRKHIPARTVGIARLHCFRAANLPSSSMNWCAGSASPGTFEKGPPSARPFFAVLIKQAAKADEPSFQEVLFNAFAPRFWAGRRLKASAGAGAAGGLRLARTPVPARGEAWPEDYRCFFVD